MRYVFLFLAFSISFIAYNQTPIIGIVLDADSKEPLPFVNISVQGKNTGTSSNIDGVFKVIADATDSVLFSYVGYREIKLAVNQLSPKIFLTAVSHQLREVEVYAGENPAFEIIRRVIKNRANNNPENLSSFSYNAYHKLFATAEGNFDTIKNKSAAANFFDKHYLFLNETYSQRKFRQPNFDKETVLANKMSGVKDPFFAVLATNFQPFTFYDDHINLLEQNYISPITEGTFKRYDFNIEDSLFHERDTTFILSFEPLPGKTFTSLKGVLYINSGGYGLENVLAEPSDASSLVRIKIQQKYSRAGQHWFPLELNTEIIFKQQKISEHPLKYVHRSYISDVLLEVPLSKKDFGLLSVEFHPDANRKTNEYWNTARQALISPKENNTYALYDSMPARRLSMVNTFMKGFEGIAAGKFKAGKFYLPLENLVRNNAYENLRLGIGLQTGEQISKLFSTDAYVAYGFRDKGIKYGAGLQVNIQPLSQTFARVSYSNDVSEVGNPDFLAPPPSVASAQTFRNWLTERMDSVTRIKAQVNFRAIRFTETSFFVQRSQHNPTFAYQFQTSDASAFQNYTLTEAGFQFKFVSGEKYSQIGNSKIITEFKYPHLNIAVTHAAKDIVGGDFTFTRIEAKFNYQFLTKGLGKTSFELDGGYLRGSAPYFRLFNGKGTNTGTFDLNSFITQHYFQTMGVYEFTSDNYLYIFFQHNFGRLVGTKSKYFRPELSFSQNAGVGQLKHPEHHQNISLRSMEKGFYESGVVINNLIRINYFNFAYLGLGGGVFYRSGPYSFDDTRDNFVKKISVTLGL